MNQSRWTPRLPGEAITLFRQLLYIAVIYMGECAAGAYCSSNKRNKSSWTVGHSSCQRILLRRERALRPSYAARAERCQIQLRSISPAAYYQLPRVHTQCNTQQSAEQSAQLTVWQRSPFRRARGVRLLASVWLHTPRRTHIHTVHERGI